MSKHLSRLFAGVALFPCAAFAQQGAESLPPVDVYAGRTSSENAAPAAPGVEIVSGPALYSQRPLTSDSAQMLSNTPGVSFYQGGGVSSMPVIHGLEDERNNVVLGGVPITAACANHMNPPMSYIDPGSIAKIEVLTANVPVSKGGDSIGGTIIVTPLPPVFAPAAAPVAKGPLPAPSLFSPASGVIASGSISTYFRSNGSGVGVSGTAAIATDHFSLDYAGGWSRSGNYTAGGGTLINSTLYEAQNHSGTLAYRNEDQQIAFHYAYQWIPYQGFPNQYMDMLGNNANTFDLSYKGGFGWGRLEANAYYHITQHYMNFLAAKNGGVDATPQTGMPMYVNGQDFGYRLKGEIDLGKEDLLRVGNELHMQRLNEWWPSPATMMGMPNNMPGWMCCGTYVNVDNGQRNVLSTYVEWERRWTKEWSTQLGLRNDTVWMNTGDVQGYNMIPGPDPMDMYGGYYGDATAFNAQDHARTFVNWDLTALARYNPDPSSAYEFGYTRKARAPSIYELYAWSTNPMAASMIGWFGDGNGYVGNLNLRPEVANTIAATGQWSDPAQKVWNVKLTPYYSYVQDYIDVNQIGTFGSGPNATNLLQFANHDAELYGFDIGGRWLFAHTLDYGDFSISGIAGYTRGWLVYNGSSLYHMMPLNGKAALENKIALFGGALTSAFEVQAAAAKSEVEAVRLEPTTPSYAVMNFRTSYEYQNLRFDLGVENIADQLYYNPLGGINIANFEAGTQDLLHTPLAAMGRTVYGGVTVKF